MPYREPGVYTELINNRPNTGFTPALIPLIIGEGPKFMDHEEVPVVRGSAGLTDILPSTKVTAINSVYTIANGVKTVIAADDNYTLTAPNIITWDEESTAKPAAGVAYYVDYEARPEDTQYEPAFITSYEELDRAYIGDLMKTVSKGDATTVNPVYLGAYIALEAGAPGVYVLQVEPSEKAETYNVTIATDMVKSLEKAEFIEDAYFVVPMTGDSTATGAVITHVNACSTVEERKERVCFISKAIADPAAANGLFSTQEITAAAEGCAAIANKRVRVPFVTKARKVLSDGVLHDLTAEYVCAALAGLASLIPVQRSLTRQRLFNFTELKHVTKLSRLVKNQLAESGFIVLEQPGGVGSAIVIRHGVTTKMDNVADREHSVVAVADYVAKYVRNTLEGYIGVFNIDNFLITKVSGSITAVRNTLVRESVIIDLIMNSIQQDQDNPDTLLLDLSLQPPYPCNYINVKILVE